MVHKKKSHIYIFILFSISFQLHFFPLCKETFPPRVKEALPPQDLTDRRPLFHHHLPHNVFLGILFQPAWSTFQSFFTLTIMFCLYLWSSSEPSWVILPPNKLFLLGDDKIAHSLSIYEDKLSILSHIGWFGNVILHLNFLSGFSDSVEKTLFLLIYRKCNFEGSYNPGKVKVSYKNLPILQSGSKE